MLKPVNMRGLRLAHGISCVELGRCAGISGNRIYQIEEGRCSLELQEERMAKAFRELIRRREEALEALKTDFSRWEGRLLKDMEEVQHEL